jgi:hypothetical protein
MMDWISVGERLPEDEQNVLLANSRLGGLPSTGWYEKALGFFLHWNFANVVVVVTHWMPLPETPKDV